MSSNDRLPSPSHDHSSTGVPEAKRRLSAGQMLVVSSVMFTFISYWRTAAVVLCDLASTAYYIGGIVEAAIGPAAPWFILAVMLFSYAVRVDLHRELLAVRPRRRVPRRQGGDGRRSWPSSRSRR